MTKLKFEDWRELYIDRGVDRYTFPDGTTVMLVDDKLRIYFDKFKDKVVLPTPSQYIEKDPKIVRFIEDRKRQIRLKIGIE